MLEEKEVIETVELTIENPVAGTKVKCNDESGFDQTPVPIVVSLSDKYAVAQTMGRDDVYWRDYATLVYYNDVEFKEGETYNVYGRIKAAPGVTFNDPVTLIVNGEENMSYMTEDYSMEADEFVFYADVIATN